MGKRGTKPVPDAIRLARGTHRPHRHGDVTTIPAGDTVAATVPAPKVLGPSGRKRWKEWTKRLSDMGLLESRHLDALEVYCRAWDSLHKSEATLKKDGEYVTAESGAMARHPAAINRDRARDDIRRYIIEFGGTPSSATSLRKDPAPKSGAVPNRKRDIG